MTLDPSSLPPRLTIAEVAELARRDVSTVYRDAKARVLHAKVSGPHKRGLTVARAEALRYAHLVEDEGTAYSEEEWEAMHADDPPPAADPSEEPHH